MRHTDVRFYIYRLKIYWFVKNNAGVLAMWVNWICISSFCFYLQQVQNYGIVLTADSARHFLLWSPVKAASAGRISVMHRATIFTIGLRSHLPQLSASLKAIPAKPSSIEQSYVITSQLYVTPDLIHVFRSRLWGVYRVFQSTPSISSKD